MSLADAMQLEGFAAQQTVSGGTFVLISSGEIFTAIIEPLSDIETQLELGADVRESSRLHVLRKNCPKQLIRPDADSQVKLTLKGQAAPVYKVVTRTDNADDIEVKFTLVKMVLDQDAP